MASQYVNLQVQELKRLMAEGGWTPESLAAALKWSERAVKNIRATGRTHRKRAEKLAAKLNERALAPVTLDRLEDPRPELFFRLPLAQSTLRKAFGRERELTLLDQAWEDPRVRVVSFIGMAGCGKSALLDHWLDAMEGGAYRGARAVFTWPFNQNPTDAAAFVPEALRIFGDPNPYEGSPLAQGQRLAERVQAKRTLLVLDGLEVLQYPATGGRPGWIRQEHVAVSVLLAQLASHNPRNSLCVITSQLPVKDLERYEPTGARQHELTGLTDRAGAELLRALVGAGGSQEQLEAISRAYQGHCLGLTLLGTYLKRAYPGEASAWDRVPLTEADEGGYVEQRLAAYEAWFRGRPELAVLRLVGLFDRPAPQAAVAGLCAAGIPDLTDALQGLSEKDWHLIVANLREARLLAEKEVPDELDAHPVARAYFGEQLRRNFPHAWQQGQRFLYEHYRQTNVEHPQSFDELAPLYQAVLHGCRACGQPPALGAALAPGLRLEDVFEDIIWERIERGFNFAPASSIIGFPFAAGLAAVGQFYRDGTPSGPEALLPAITAPRTRVHIFASTAMLLTAYDKNAEACRFWDAAKDLAEQGRDWSELALILGYSTIPCMNQGDIARALEYGKACAALAERRGPGSDLHRMALSNYAARLAQAGHAAQALAAYQQAGAVPVSATNFSAPFFLLWFQEQEFLLEQGVLRDEPAPPADPRLLPIAGPLSGVLRGRLLHRKARGRTRRRDLERAVALLTQAVEDLRKFGGAFFLIPAWLALAAVQRDLQQWAQAKAKLQEAMALAVQAEFPLKQADCHLGEAQWHAARGEAAKARRSLAATQSIIDQTGYRRLDGEIADVAARLAGGGKQRAPRGGRRPPEDGKPTAEG